LVVHPAACTRRMGHDVDRLPCVCGATGAASFVRHSVRWWRWCTCANPHEIAHGEGELPAPGIPRATTGRPRVENLQVSNGLVYKVRPGIPGVACRNAAGFEDRCTLAAATPLRALAWVWVGCVVVPTTWWRSRPAVPADSAPTCDNAGLAAPSRRSWTRDSTAATESAAAAGHPASTARYTAAVTPSSGVSTR